jgi:universal stress protein A
MANYRKILLATDFLEFSGEVAGRALEISSVFGAQLSVLHVVDPLPMLDPGYAEILPLELDLTEKMLEASKARLEKLADHLNIPKERQLVEVGSPKAEIVRVAAEQSIDLIVIGTHGRHGFGVLLGSTAASVVNHAGCDVLTVRLRDTEN